MFTGKRDRVSAPPRCGVMTSRKPNAFSWACRSLIAAMTRGLDCAVPAFTSSTPSGPTDAAMFVPAPTSIQMFLRTGHQCSSPALSPPRCAARCCASAAGLRRRIRHAAAASAQRDAAEQRVRNAVAPSSLSPRRLQRRRARRRARAFADTPGYIVSAPSKYSVARQAVVIGEAIDLIVLAGQPVRHVALGPHDLGDDRARVGRHLLREIRADTPCCGSAAP